MAPAAFRRHRKRGGESPPYSSSSLTFSIDGRRVSPLVHYLHGVGGREPLRDWICLSISLCFCALDSTLSPFLIYQEIRNSDWIETLAHIFLQKLAFLRPKKSSNRLTGAGEGQGRTPLPRGPLEHRLALILLPIFSKYSKNILCPFLSCLHSV